VEELTPRVSVLVTVYNRESYLRDTLQSILASTFTDIEVIVVDDCSADTSLKIAQECAEQDSRLQVHSNKQNLGDYPNRMKAASLARGCYIKYVDSDDLIAPEGLEVMMRAMEAHPEVVLGLCQGETDPEHPYPEFLTPEAAYQRHFLGRGCLTCGPSGAIMRRDAFEKCGGFRDWGVASDNDLWLRLAAAGPVLFLPPALIWWRRHSGQEYSRIDVTMAYLLNRYRIKCEALGVAACPLADEERAQALQRVTQHQARKIWSLLLRSLAPRLAFTAYRDSGMSVSQLFGGLRPYS